MTVETKYKELGLKIDYNNFNGVFEICALDLDKCGIFSKAVLRVVVNRIRTYLSYLEPLVNTMPHTFYHMVVFKNASDEDKERAGVFYRRLMDFYHEALIAEMKGDKEIVKFLENLWKEWEDFDIGVVNVLKICKAVWLDKKEDEKNSSEYLG